MKRRRPPVPPAARPPTPAEDVGMVICKRLYSRCACQEASVEKGVCSSMRFVALAALRFVENADDAWLARLVDELANGPAESNL